MHVTTDPAILYFGTPVVLISTLNEDATPNLAPMSSAWWLDHRCMLGLSNVSQTTLNLQRTGECVLNLPSAGLVAHVDSLARTTGSDPVPDNKLRRGYRHEGDKFGLAGLTPLSSDTVGAPTVAECPVALEASLVHTHPFGPDGAASALEVSIDRIRVHETILAERDRIDPDAWRPLIMSFQHFYGLTDERLQTSELASIPEESYRS